MNATFEAPDATGANQNDAGISLSENFVSNNAGGREPETEVGSDSAEPDQGATDVPQSTGLKVASLLVEKNLIDRKQLGYALRVQEKLASHKTLLNTMVELEFFTQEQLNVVLKDSTAGIRMGDLLVELGDITEAELQNVLRLQRTDLVGMKFGEILLDQRLIRESRLLDVLSNKLGYPHIEPDFTQIEPAVLDLLSASWCEKLHCIPVRKIDNTLHVACSDPNDEELQTVLARNTGCDVILSITTQHGLKEAISKYKFRESGKSNKAQPDGESSAVRNVDELLDAAVKSGASDIHMESTSTVLRVRFRRDGVLWQFKDYPKEFAPAMIVRLKVMAGADVTEKRRHQDGKLEFREEDSGQMVDVRLSFYVSIHGEKVCMRLLSRKAALLDIEAIGMAASVLERFKREALDVPAGVVLITGPTGSGKTTTLYGCVDYLNNDETSIITAEEPVEYVIEGITQCSLNPKIDVTYDETLRHMVRQDPDVIVLGEIRDGISAEAAIQAALTGHKVLTTFHTEDTIGGLLRLMNMDIETFLISSTVVSVMAQRLIRRVCPDCGEPYAPSPLELQRLGLSSASVKGAEFMMGKGCDYCQHTGYKGRICVFELLVLNEQVKDAILNRKASYDIRKISIETSGLITLLEDGFEKASRGLTTLAEVYRMLPRMEAPRPLAEIQRLGRSNLM